MTATRSFWAGSVGDFLAEPKEHILGSLALRVGQEYASDESRQIISWRRELDILQDALNVFVTDHPDWGLLLELPLLRLGRRIDAVLLIRNRVCPIEFKIGATKFHASDVEQAVDYALCLRDFHGASRHKEIFPILCASDPPLKGAIDEGPPFALVDQVTACVHANASTLGAVIERLSVGAEGPQMDWRAFDVMRWTASARGIFVPKCGC